jgi:prepilin-type N-terminal cleavage/methylation domain-containing protein
MKSNQKGFSVIEILLVIVVVGLIGTVGWLVYDRQNSDTDAQANQNSVQEQGNTEEDQPIGDKDTSNVPEGWTTYDNETLGFSFNYPSEYGGVKEDSSYGSENQNALRYTFYFEKICPSCDTDNPYAVDMASDGIVEIGANTSEFGGIGTGRPYASSAGFDGEGNFQADGTKGLLKTTTDDLHNKVRTTIEFNLTKSAEATGIMFMTNDEPNESSNAENLKQIAKTFKLLP